MIRTAYPSLARLGTLLVLLLTAPALFAGEVLFRVHYEFNLGGVSVGKAVRSLERDGDLYQFRSDARPTGFMANFVKKSFHERDRWRLHEGNLRPLAYRYYEQEKGQQDDKVKLHFDWEDGVAWDPNGKQCWPLIEHSQDPASATFAIMQAVAQGQDEIAIHSIGGRVPVDHQYRVSGEGKFGEDKVYKVIKVEEETDRRIRLHAWLAPELGYLPVYIHQEVRGGADTRLTMTRLESLDKEALLRIWAE
ncbi:MAG: DUF3108 domain-containing protein [Gammaproteobacteria bacterium]|nr:DUF3108 domain-containing protein [Gammaproteobacteria bacterium]